MNKVVSAQTALSHVKDGCTIMVGGFMANGTPETLIDKLCKNKTKDLTLICNDTAFVDRGVGKMVVNKQFKKIIASHIGLNKETGRQMNAFETEVELIPQGTLAEQIRSAGFGLGGVLTKTGLGTLVEQGKEKVTVEGEEFILEKPISADIAIIFASKADKAGNLVYKGSMNNFNNLMASAAKITIVEVDEIVEVGEINQNEVVTPGIFIDFIVEGGNSIG
ncbi:MAG: CoA transferase subunit A [Clostridioides sp.]|jgi:acetate CoA/acetoacetate CoA-transferase alpha subunit|nr:CoA transferase subunit A [Clostridioides sp.]